MLGGGGLAPTWRFAFVDQAHRVHSLRQAGWLLLKQSGDVGAIVLRERGRVQAPPLDDTRLAHESLWQAQGIGTSLGVRD